MFNTLCIRLVPVFAATIEVGRGLADTFRDYGSKLPADTPLGKRIFLIIIIHRSCQDLTTRCHRCQNTSLLISYRRLPQAAI